MTRLGVVHAAKAEVPRAVPVARNSGSHPQRAAPHPKAGRNGAPKKSP